MEGRKEERKEGRKKRRKKVRMERRKEGKEKRKYKLTWRIIIPTHCAAVYWATGLELHISEIIVLWEKRDVIFVSSPTSYLALFTALSTTQWQAVADEATIGRSGSSSGHISN